MSAFTVNVKHLSDKTYQFQVTPTTTILQLKQQISSSLSIPADEIKLISKGRILKINDDKMQDLNIDAGSTIHMVHQKQQADADKANINPTGTTTSTTTPPPANPFANFASGNANMGGLGGLGGLGGMGGLGGAGLEGLDLNALGGADLGGIDPSQIQNLMNNPQVR